MGNYEQDVYIRRFLLFIMRITFFLFVMGVLNVHATNSYAQNTQLTIRENNIEIGDNVDIGIGTIIYAKKKCKNWQ